MVYYKLKESVPKIYQTSGRNLILIGFVSVSKLKRMNSLQRSFEMFSSPSQSGNNPFKKNALKPPLSETLPSKNLYVDSQDEVLNQSISYEQIF